MHTQPLHWTSRLRQETNHVISDSYLCTICTTPIERNNIWLLHNTWTSALMKHYILWESLKTHRVKVHKCYIGCKDWTRCIDRSMLLCIWCQISRQIIHPGRELLPHIPCKASCLCIPLTAKWHLQGYHQSPNNNITLFNFILDRQRELTSVIKEYLLLY